MPPLIDHSEEDERTEYNEQHCNKIYFKSDNEEQLALEDEEFTAIKGFEGGDGERLLRFLNEQTKKQQLENGVNVSDVYQGKVILNCIGHVLVK